MADRFALTFVLMDPPYEDARSTTALRLIAAALAQGCDVNVFAYEGAVCLAQTDQRPHANPVHQRTADEEQHPLPFRWVEALAREAADRGLRLDWVNCGLCVDERGADAPLAGCRRGSPADLLKMADASRNVLVIPTK